MCVGVWVFVCLSRNRIKCTELCYVDSVRHRVYFFPSFSSMRECRFLAVEYYIFKEKANTHAHRVFDTHITTVHSSHSSPDIRDTLTKEPIVVCFYLIIEWMVGVFFLFLWFFFFIIISFSLCSCICIRHHSFCFVFYRLS